MQAWSALRGGRLLQQRADKNYTQAGVAETGRRLARLEPMPKDGTQSTLPVEVRTALLVRWFLLETILTYLLTLGICLCEVSVETDAPWG